MGRLSSLMEMTSAPQNFSILIIELNREATLLHIAKYSGRDITYKTKRQSLWGISEHQDRILSAGLDVEI